MRLIEQRLETLQFKLALKALNDNGVISFDLTLLFILHNEASIYSRFDQSRAEFILLPLCYLVCYVSKTHKLIIITQPFPF